MSLLTLDRRGRWGLFLLLIAAAILYLATLDNGLAPADLVGGDLITHHYAQAQARPANAPGYPLYTIGGWLWFHGLRLIAPAANPIALLSSYSTLWGLLSLALLFGLLHHFSGRVLAVSLGLSAFYAVTYFFWFYSVTSEQYTSAIFHTLALAALAHAWDHAPRDRTLLLIALGLGLALAHMITVLLLGPGLLLFLLSKQPALLRRGRLILHALGLALLPLLSYAYVYLRGAAHPEWWGEGTWATPQAWFLSFLSTAQGRDELTWALGPFTSEFPRLIWVEMTPLLLILGVAGWALLGRRTFLFYALTALLYFLFCYIDRLGNWFQVILPLYPLILLGAGVSLGRLWQRFPAHALRGALILLLLALILLKFTQSSPRAMQRDRAGDTGLRPGQAILAVDPPAGAAILAAADETLALDYLTGVWGIRPDLRAIATDQAAAALAAGAPLAVTPAAAPYAAAETGLPLRYTAWSDALLLAQPAALPPPPPMAAASVPLGDGLHLAGFELLTGPEAGVWRLRLALAAQQAPQQDWALSARLLIGGEEAAQSDQAAPAASFTPTTSLRPGEIVAAAFRFILPAAPAPDAVRVILYRPLPGGGFENLILLDLTLPPP